MEMIIIAVLALAVGIFVGIAVEIGKVRSLSTKAEMLGEKISELEASHARALAEKDENARKALEESERNHALVLEERERRSRELLEERDARHRELIELNDTRNREALDALQKRFDETVARMQQELENATSKMLRERQSEFESSSRESVSRILEPLQESIRQMKETVADNTVKHTEFGGRLTANIDNLMRQSEAARISADKLADALRRGGRVQGDWGETVLTELLESQGLKEGIHFDTQSVLRDSGGNAVRTETSGTLRPDVILHLDRTRDVIIDAKVSLSAYLDYINAETEEARDPALTRHLESVRRHVRELAAKDYSAYVQPPKVRMGYVIMFVPNTAALFAATSRDSGLWRWAMEQNVYIADEQTLYAALRIINLTWVQIAQAENHEKVYALAEEMLTRVSQFMEKFTAIGKNIDAAQKSYEDSLAKLVNSGRSIPQTCGKLIKLGAKAQKRKGVPDALIGLADDDSVMLPDKSQEPK